MKLRTRFPDPNILAEDTDEISFPDEIWVQVFDDSNQLLIEISSKEILGHTLYSEDQYEGAEASLLPDHLVVSSWAGGGQGGGVAIWRLADKSLIFSDREFAVHAALVMPKQKMLLFMHSLAIWDQRPDILKVVKYDGSSTAIDLNSERLPWLAAHTEPKASTSEAPQILYDPESDRLLFYGNAMKSCSVQDLLNFLDSEK